MQNALLAPPALSSAPTPFVPAPHANSLARRSSAGPCADREFIALLEAYRSSGGLAQAREVRGQVERQRDTSLAMLASWIGGRQLICFVWQAKMWLPLFQFKAPGMTPVPGLHEVLAELAPAYADWELAQWFVRPQAGLANRTPADTLAQDLNAVLQAARIDPLVVRH